MPGQNVSEAQPTLSPHSGSLSGGAHLSAPPLFCEADNVHAVDVEATGSSIDLCDAVVGQLWRRSRRRITTTALRSVPIVPSCDLESNTTKHSIGYEKCCWYVWYATATEMAVHQYVSFSAYRKSSPTAYCDMKCLCLLNVNSNLAGA